MTIKMYGFFFTAIEFNWRFVLKIKPCVGDKRTQTELLDAREKGRQRASVSEEAESVRKRGEGWGGAVVVSVFGHHFWAKNVSVTAALCISLAWVTPVTQTFPSSLHTVLSHCCSSGSLSTHTHTQHHRQHTISLSFLFPGQATGSVIEPKQSRTVRTTWPRQGFSNCAAALVPGQNCSCSPKVFRTSSSSGPGIHPSAWQGDLWAAEMPVSEMLVLAKCNTCNMDK